VELFHRHRHHHFGGPGGFGGRSGPHGGGWWKHGASDAGAHVQYNTDSCYAVWTLQHWVRERGVLTIEQAIKMLTADQADLFGFRDRGRVQLGLAADLVLFDPDRVGTTGVRYVRDQPADGTRLVTDAVGVVASVVNGVVATRDGSPTGARPGRFLR